MTEQLQGEKLPGSDTGKGLTAVVKGAAGGPSVSSLNPANLKEREERVEGVGDQDTHPVPMRRTRSQQAGLNEEVYKTSTRTTKRIPLQLQYPTYEPEHKRCKEQLKLIRILGYEEFNDLPILFDYYEPSLPNELTSKKNARRQKECARLDEWIKAKQIEKFGRPPPSPANKKKKVEDTPRVADLEVLTDTESQADAETMDSQMQCLLSENEYLREKAEDYEEQCGYAEQLEGQVQALKTKLESYVASVATEKQERQKLEKRLDELETQYCDLRDENTQLREENSHLKEEVEQHRSKQPTYLAELQKKLEETNKNLMKERIDCNQLRLEIQRSQISQEGASNTPLGEDLQATIAKMIEKALTDIMPRLQSVQYQPHKNTTETPGTAELLHSETGFQFPRTRPTRRRAPMQAQPQGPEPAAETQTPNLRNKPSTSNPSYSTALRKEKQQQQQIPVKSGKQGQQKRQPASRPPRPPATEAPPPVSKVLILPKGGGKTVITSMREQQIRARQLGIKNAVEFPSGATLLIVEPEKLQELEKQVTALGHQKKPQRVKDQHTLRIHDIPDYNSVDDVREDITRALGHAPLNIEFAYYREEAKKDVRMAIVECSKELWMAAETRRTLAIDLKRCRIDTSIRLMRCKDCKLYGHTKNHCTGIPEGVKDKEGCQDCLVYNKRIADAGLHKSRLRNAQHQAGEKSCPTKQALLKKHKAMITGNGE